MLTSQGWTTTRTWKVNSEHHKYTVDFPDIGRSYTVGAISLGEALAKVFMVLASNLHLENLEGVRYRVTGGPGEADH